MHGRKKPNPAKPKMVSRRSKGKDTWVDRNEEKGEKIWKNLFVFCSPPCLLFPRPSILLPFLSSICFFSAPFNEDVRFFASGSMGHAWGLEEDSLVMAQVGQPAVLVS